jgi:hypothetical protein
MDQSTLLTKRETRELLLRELYNATTTTDISAPLVSGWISSLNSLTANPTELSTVAAGIASSTATLLLSYATWLNLPYDRLEAVLSTINNIAAATAGTSTTTARARQLSTASAGLVVTQQALLDSFSSLVVSQIDDAQYDLSWIQDSFRLTCSSVLLSGSATLSTSPPLTSLESYSGVLSSKMTLTGPGIATTEYTKLCTASTSAKVFADSVSSSLLANPVSLTVADLSLLCPSGTCKFSVLLPNLESTTYISKSDVNVTFTTVCDHMKAMPYTVSNSCPDGSVVAATCSVAEVISTCPITFTEPICTAIDKYSATSEVSGCSLVSYTSTQSLFSCEVSSSIFTSSSSSGRRLSTTTPAQVALTTVAKSQTISYPSTIIYTSPSPTVAPTVANGVASSSSTTTSGGSRSGVIAGAASAGAFVLLLGAFFIYRRNKSKGKKPKGKGKGKTPMKGFVQNLEDNLDFGDDDGAHGNRNTRNSATLAPMEAVILEEVSRESESQEEHDEMAKAAMRKSLGWEGKNDDKSSESATSVGFVGKKSRAQQQGRRNSADFAIDVDEDYGAIDGHAVDMGNMQDDDEDDSVQSDAFGVRHPRDRLSVRTAGVSWGDVYGTGAPATGENLFQGGVIRKDDESEISSSASEQRASLDSNTAANTQIGKQDFSYTNEGIDDSKSAGKSAGKGKGKGSKGRV